MPQLSYPTGRHIVVALAALNALALAVIIGTASAQESRAQDAPCFPATEQCKCLFAGKFEGNQCVGAIGQGDDCWIQPDCRGE